MSDCELSVDFAKILQLHHADFRETLNVRALIPLMGKYNLLTGEERQEIQCKATDAERIDHLIHILPRKGKCAYQTFIRCLESEKQHLGHPELVIKLKKTVEWLKTQHIYLFQSADTSADTDGKTTTEHIQESAVFVKQLKFTFNEKDKTIKDLKEKLASLENQLQQKDVQLRQKDKLISDLQSHSSHTQFHAVSEVAKFQQLVDYVNGSHASQLCDTLTIAKHYRDLRPIMKDAKHHLKRHSEYVKYCIHTTSEESDGIRSRTSSELSSESVKVFKEESAGDSASYSSADETDDEGLDAKLEPEDEHKIVHRLKSQQRPESRRAAFRERRASKVISRYSMSFTTQPRKGSTTDSDANDDKQLLEGLGIVDVSAAIGEVEHQNEDVNLACSNVGLSSIDDQNKLSCTVLEGYLHKGSGPHDRWKKRYFTLTQGYLYYSKSHQVSRSRPINVFPLIGLALERKEKSRTFEVINIQATQIKVDKPGRRHVPIANCKVIKLKASSETEALKWIQSIEDAITKLRSQFLLAHD